MKSGILLIDKTVGTTSRQEVNYLMHSFHEKKMGHIGTLDPFADGLLIVLVGRGTKISPYLENKSKTYLATLKLGIKTDSADITGNIIEMKDVPSLSKDKIKEVFASFIGERKQLPPMYSAIKINGKELYKYARSGEEVIRKERDVTIYSLDLVSFSNDEIVFLSHVSKGTYIRTLGEEIAEALGCVGTLTKLTRTSIGNFSLKDAKKKEEVLEDDIIDIKQALSFMKIHEVSENELKPISNGMHLKLKECEPLVLCVYKDEALAIYARQDNGYYRCERGLK